MRSAGRRTGAAGQQGGGGSSANHSRAPLLAAAGVRSSTAQFIQAQAAHRSLNTMLDSGRPGSMRVSSVSSLPGSRMTGRAMGRPSSPNACSILLAAAGREGGVRARQLSAGWAAGHGREATQHTAHGERDGGLMHTHAAGAHAGSLGGHALAAVRDGVILRKLAQQLQVVLQREKRYDEAEATRSRTTA